MLVYLSGTVLHHGVGYIIVEQSGVGYKVSLPENVAHEIHESTHLYIHEVIRDSERELFGFTSIEQLELFWKLIAVSGVGPRSAQKIVYADAVDRVKSKIMAGDLTSLTNVPGVGKKTAQKIILELKGLLPMSLMSLRSMQMRLMHSLGLDTPFATQRQPSRGLRQNLQRIVFAQP